jgi:hypothetical protein
MEARQTFTATNELQPQDCMTPNEALRLRTSVSDQVEETKGQNPKTNFFEQAQNFFS